MALNYATVSGETNKLKWSVIYEAEETLSSAETGQKYSDFKLLFWSTRI